MIGSIYILAMCATPNLDEHVACVESQEKLICTVLGYHVPVGIPHQKDMNPFLLTWRPQFLL